MSTTLQRKKTILIIYHSQSGTMELMANQVAQGAAREDNVEVRIKQAVEATLIDLLNCDAIAIGSPEYFGTMAGMIKDFFDRTYEDAKDRTIGLPFVIFVCAGNDGRGAISQIEKIVSGYKWKKILEHVRITGTPSPIELEELSELGHTLSAGLDFGIY